MGYTGRHFSRSAKVFPSISETLNRLTVKYPRTSHFCFRFHVFQEGGGQLFLGGKPSVEKSVVSNLYCPSLHGHTLDDRLPCGYSPRLGPWVTVVIPLRRMPLWDQSAPGGVIAQLLPCYCLKGIVCHVPGLQVTGETGSAEVMENDDTHTELRSVHGPVSASHTQALMVMGALWFIEV